MHSAFKSLPYVQHHLCYIFPPVWDHQGWFHLGCWMDPTTSSWTVTG